MPNTTPSRRPTPICNALRLSLPHDFNERAPIGGVAPSTAGDLGRLGAGCRARLLRRQRQRQGEVVEGVAPQHAEGSPRDPAASGTPRGAEKCGRCSRTSPRPCPHGVPSPLTHRGPCRFSLCGGGSSKAAKKRHRPPSGVWSKPLQTPSSSHITLLQNCHTCHFPAERRTWGAMPEPVLLS